MESQKDGLGQGLASNSQLWAVVSSLSVGACKERFTFRGCGQSGGPQSLSKPHGDKGWGPLWQGQHTRWWCWSPSGTPCSALGMQQELGSGDNQTDAGPESGAGAGAIGV